MGSANNNQHIQQILIPQCTNEPWGDALISPKPFGIFWVISKNVNMLSSKQSYLPWKAAAHSMQTLSADSASLQETNLAWNKGHQKRVHTVFQHPSSHKILVTSSSCKPSANPYQPRGTAQIIIGHTTARTIKTGNDPSRQGRWSYVKMQGTNNKQLIILSGYQVGPNQTFDLGSNTRYNQQCRILVNNTIQTQIQGSNTLMSSSTKLQNGESKTMMF